MTTHHTLGTTIIPRGMVWVDEFDWVPVERFRPVRISQ